MLALMIAVGALMGGGLLCATLGEAAVLALPVAALLTALGPVMAAFLLYQYPMEYIFWCLLIVGSIAGALVYWAIVRCRSEAPLPIRWQLAMAFGVVLWLGVGFLSSLALIQSGI